MIKYTYSFDQKYNRFTITGNFDPDNKNYDGAASEAEARADCARKIDAAINSFKSRINDSQREIDRLTEARNAVYMGELPPLPSKS